MYPKKELEKLNKSWRVGLGKIALHNRCLFDYYGTRRVPYSQNFGLTKYLHIFILVITKKTPELYYAHCIIVGLFRFLIEGIFKIV